MLGSLSSRGEVRALQLSYEGRKRTYGCLIPSAIMPREGKGHIMMKSSAKYVGSVSVILAALSSVACGAGVDEESAAAVESAVSSSPTDPVPCAAWADTVVANTSSISIAAGTLIDSYQSSLGAYGGSNVGSAAIVQAGTTISNNGGTIKGTQKKNTPGGFSVVPVPAGATNLPLGSSTPGSLSINTAAQSITLAPGNYVAANVNVGAPGAITVSPPGQVRIWVTNSLNLGGNVNVNGSPKNLAFLMNNAGWVNVNSGGSFNGLIYAPTSNVAVNEPVFGSIIGKSVTLNSGGAVHFDQSSASCTAPKTAQLDQSFTSPGGLSDGLYGKPVLMAQSYTASVSGTLQGVSLDVTAMDVTKVARIQIEAISNGVPSNVVLGQARAAAGGDLSLNTVIPFTTAIPQVAGQQYAILVDYPEAAPFVDGIQNTASWNGAGDNAYTAGTLYSTFDNGTTWKSYETDGFDVHFKTFVVPN